MNFLELAKRSYYAGSQSKQEGTNDLLQEILQDMKGLLIRGQHFVPPNSEQLRDPGRSWNIREQQIEQEI